MIRGIHHTAISTGDLGRALSFYRDLLGFEVVLEFAWPKGSDLADQITGIKGSAAKAAMLRASRSAGVRSRHYAHSARRPQHRR
jgi:catechol 2,3-dioxygenase-like lactoylglutathione lyase family enzyme